MSWFLESRCKLHSGSQEAYIVMHRRWHLLFVSGCKLWQCCGYSRFSLKRQQPLAASFPYTVFCVDSVHWLGVVYLVMMMQVVIIIIIIIYLLKKTMVNNSNESKIVSNENRFQFMYERSQCRPLRECKSQGKIWRVAVVETLWRLLRPSTVTCSCELLSDRRLEATQLLSQGFQ